MILPGNNSAFLYKNCIRELIRDTEKIIRDMITEKEIYEALRDAGFHLTSSDEEVEEFVKKYEQLEIEIEIKDQSDSHCDSTDKSNDDHELKT